MPKYWPTVCIALTEFTVNSMICSAARSTMQVGTRCYNALVQTPGIADLPLEMFDTSGNTRFKPLSLVFYRQAQAVILVFDVKSMASFRALGEVGLRARVMMRY